MRRISLEKSTKKYLIEEGENPSKFLSVTEIVSLFYPETLYVVTRADDTSVSSHERDRAIEFLKDYNSCSV